MMLLGPIDNKTALIQVMAKAPSITWNDDNILRYDIASLAHNELNLISQGPMSYADWLLHNLRSTGDINKAVGISRGH